MPPFGLFCIDLYFVKAVILCLLAPCMIFYFPESGNNKLFSIIAITVKIIYD